MNLPASKQYEKAPIVEAVVEVRFASRLPWTETTLERVGAAVAKTYKGKPERRNEYTVQARLEGGDFAAEGAVSFHQQLFPSEDRRSIVGVGENRLSVHVLAPYPGWDKFLPRVKEALEVYASEAKPDGVTLVGVRYIDQIGVPDDKPLDAFFTCLPPAPNGMPPALDGFHYVTQARDAGADYSAVLTLASVPTQGPTARPVVLYDLNLVRVFPAVPASVSDVEQHVVFLHERQKTIFEGSITDLTRGLFT